MKRLLVLFMVVLLAIVGIGCGPGQVSTGELGVITRFGRVTGDVRQPGFFFVGIGTGVQHMNTQIQAFQTDADAASKDLQDAKTTVVLNFKLDPTKVIEIFSTLGQDYGHRIIVPAVQESLKATTAKFNAEELITQRSVVKDAIEKSLRERLTPFGIHVDAVSITNFSFSKEFTAAIEQKVAAAQAALQAENKLRQVEVEAQQAKAQAEGVRDAIIANSTGQAKAILLIAEAQAQANKIINASISEQLNRYNLAKSIAAGTKIVIVPTGSNFLFGDAILGEGK